MPGGKYFVHTMSHLVLFAPATASTPPPREAVLPDPRDDKLVVLSEYFVIPAAVTQKEIREPVMYLIYATWCSACHELMRQLRAELAERQAPKKWARLRAIDIDGEVRARDGNF